MLIQLPDGVVARGYKLVRPCHYEQIFYSPSEDFTGTEKDFLSAGLAYEYRQINAHMRIRRV